MAPGGTLSDLEGSALTALTATITNRPNGNTVESLSLDATGSAAATSAGLTVTYTASTGVLSISGSASAATYQAILRGIQYSNTSNTPNTADRIVTLAASDGAGSTTRTATINVLSVNDAPTLNALANPPVLPTDAGLQTISLSGITVGPGESQTLTVTAASSNTGLIPNPTVTYTSPAATDSLNFTPANGQTGTATITVAVADSGGTANGGVNSFTRSFAVVVALRLDADSGTVAKEGAGFRVGFTGIAARTYTIRYSSTLAVGSWIALGTATADAQGRFTFLNTPPPGTPRRFYKATDP